MIEGAEEAIKEAEAELDGMDQKCVQMFTDWWRKYYMRTGHKMLGRLLLGNTAIEGIDELAALTEKVASRRK